MFLFFAGAVLHDAAYSLESTNENNKIQIKADTLVAYNEASYAEFTGSVMANQGTTQITSDKLKVFYSKTSDSKGIKSSGDESIKKVTASGNVVIHFENRTAYTSQAEYTPATKVIVLSGPNSKVTSGENYVSGEKITLYINEDRVVVERSKENQVEAVFYSGEMEKNP